MYEKKIVVKNSALERTYSKAMYLYIQEKWQVYDDEMMLLTKDFSQNGYNEENNLLGLDKIDNGIVLNEFG